MNPLFRWLEWFTGGAPSAYEAGGAPPGALQLPLMKRQVFHRDSWGGDAHTKVGAWWRCGLQFPQPLHWGPQPQAFRKYPLYSRVSTCFCTTSWGACRDLARSSTDQLRPSFNNSTNRSNGGSPPFFCVSSLRAGRTCRGCALPGLKKGTELALANLWAKKKALPPALASMRNSCLVALNGKHDIACCTYGIPQCIF